MDYMRHVASGEVHAVTNTNGYGLPDWEALPAKPAGPIEQWRWTGAEWAKDNALGLQILRAKRDTLLDATDKFMVSDRPISAEVRTQWEEYRQSLRDLPENTLDPFNPEWPTSPE